MFCGKCGFTDKASHIQGTREDVTKMICFGAVVKTEPRRTFDATAGLVGVTAFCIAETSDAQLPRRRIDLKVASKTDATIRESDVDSSGIAQGVIRVAIRAGQDGRCD